MRCPQALQTHPRRQHHPVTLTPSSPRPGEQKALSDPRSRPRKGSRWDRAAGRTVTLCIPCSVASRHRLPPHRQGSSAAPLGTAMIAAAAPPSRPAAGSSGRGTTTPTGSVSARHGAVARRLATRQPRAVTAATRPDPDRRQRARRQPGRGANRVRDRRWPDLSSGRLQGGDLGLAEPASTLPASRRRTTTSRSWKATRWTARRLVPPASRL